MAKKNTGIKQFLVVLILILLVSISFLVLEFSSYLEGNWQTVQGFGLRQGVREDEPFQIQILEKTNYQENYWDVLREGRLFYKPLPVVVQETFEQQPEIYIPAYYENSMPPAPPKPTCPWIALGILYGQESTALLANQHTQETQTVRTGNQVGEYRVLEISKNFVRLKYGETEFKLELGGN